MKKLTAGIFAGILTIVTVNAADAAIASKAYVDQQDKVNTTAITNLNTTVGEHTTDITALETAVGNSTSGLVKDVNDLKGTVGNETDGLVADVAALKTSVGEGGSVADKIATALEPYAKTADMTTELGKKQDKSTAAYSMGNAEGGWTALTADEQNALKSGATTEKIAKIATNETAITNLTTTVGNMDTAYKAADTAINNKIGTVADGKNVMGIIGTVPADKTVVGLIDEAKTAASGDVDAKLGELPAGSTVKAELDKKQDMLGTSNVTTTGTGNAIVSISADNGTVTATRGAVVPEVTTKGEAGTFVLTAVVSDTGVTSYQWESIERGTATPTTTE